MNWAVNCKFRMRWIENTNKNKNRTKDDGKAQQKKVKYNFQETEQLTNKDERAHQQKSTTDFQEWAHKTKLYIYRKLQVSVILFFILFIFFFFIYSSDFSCIYIFNFSIQSSVLLLFLLISHHRSLFLVPFHIWLIQMMALHSSVYAPADFQCVCVCFFFSVFFHLYATVAFLCLFFSFSNECDANREHRI